MTPTPAHHLPPPLRKLLAPLLSQEPAAQLIRSTARQQWRLLAVNLGSSVVEALSEGATLAVEVLAAPEDARFNWSTHQLPATARIHSQVLRLSFPCASGTKVGDPTDDASQGPEAIRIQIEQSGQLLVLLLLSATVLAELVGISPWLLLAVVPVGAALRDWVEPGLASP